MRRPARASRSGRRRRVVDGDGDVVEVAVERVPEAERGRERGRPRNRCSRARQRERARARGRTVMLRYRSFVPADRVARARRGREEGHQRDRVLDRVRVGRLGDASAAAACRTPRRRARTLARAELSARSRARNAPSAVALSGESSIFIERRMRSYIEMCSTAKSSASTVVYTRWLPLRPKTW